jgi:Calx-beta domain/FG-GAP-like repeat
MQVFAQGGCSTAGFRVARSFDIGTNTAFSRVALAADDFNGDGKSDIAATDLEGNSVAVFLNDGNGWFPAPTKFAVGTRPSAIAYADINGDSKPDLITANSGSNNVSVLLGASGGAFGPATNFAAGTGPGSLTLGDFNGDGNIDIVVGNVESRNVSLLLGNGTGSFSPGPSLIFEGQVLAVNSADFNSDSKRDLVVTTYGVGQSENGLFVLTGNGAGGFSAPLLVFGAAGLAISTADLNGDSKPDLVQGHFGGMVVAIGNGAGGFSPPTLFNLEAGGSVDSVAVGDVDGDSKVDVIVASISLGVTIFKGDGAGNLSRGRTYVAKSNPSNISLSDFDGDGKQDIAAAGPSGATISFSILLNTGSATFGAPQAVATIPGVTFGVSATDVAIGDFNGDNHLDIAVSHSSQAGVAARIAILLNDGSGGFTRPTPISYFPATSLHRVVTADFNEDGKVDIAVAGTLGFPFMHMVSISLGNGDGTFAAPVNISGVGGDPYDLAVAEFNNDGNLDIVVVSGSQSYTVLLGNGSGGFTFGSSQSAGTRFDRVAVGDFNGDSSQDLVITDFDDSRLVVLQNNGSGVFSVSQSFNLPGRTSAVVVDDFNSDGKRDIAAATQVQSLNAFLEEGHISVLIGDGMGGFAVAVPYEISAMPEDLISRDLNGDGKPDLAVADRNSSTVSILSGNGAGGFLSAIHYEIPGGPWALDAHDFDDDTHLDLVVVSPFGLSVDILFGKTVAAEPCMFADDLTITEEDVGLTIEIPVRLSAPSAQVVKVNYLFRGFSAAQNQDFTAQDGILTFQLGETSKVIPVSITGDVIDEPDQSFALILSTALNAQISDGIAKITILDNDPPPSIAINDVTVLEGDSIFTPNIAQFSVTLSNPSEFFINVNFAVAGGTAILSDDVEPSQGTLTFQPLTTSKTVNVAIRGDINIEPDETFFVNLSQPQQATIGDGQGVGTITNDDATVQFDASALSVAENDNRVNLTVTRVGATFAEVTIDYKTSDTAFLTNCNVFEGRASSRCDYATSIRTLKFAPGETAKDLSIPIVDDAYAEGNETFTITLSNPIGVRLGAPASAIVTISDNETVSGPNPVDQTAFFVRQHYVDFLGREPDPAGAAGWEAVINGCPASDTSCDRIHVSSAFFRSAEFQGRGYFLYRFYPVSFGRKPRYDEFIPDLAKVSGFLSDTELEAAKAAFINEFMGRPEFLVKYNGLNNTQYVDTLLTTAGITHPARDFWIVALGDGSRTRAQVLREIAESGEVYNKYFNQAFVVMQYFGYLRRQPDAFYLDWIAVLDANPNDYRGMVSGFMNSAEYRLRFGP